MAQDELTRLQKSLANYETKNTSGQYASTVANIQNQINNLKGQAEFGTKPTTATGITTPKSTATTNTGTPTVVTQSLPTVTASTPKVTTSSAGSMLPSAKSTKSTSSGTVPGTGAAGTTAVVTPVSTTGQTGQVGGQVGGQTGQVVGQAGQVAGQTGQVTQPALNLRDVAASAGLTVGNQGSVPTINGQAIDPAKYGMQLVDGRWQGTPGQIGASLGNPIGLRESLEAIGRTVTYDPKTGQVAVNKIPIDTSQMININGRFYTTQDAIDSIIARTGGQIPLGTEFDNIAGKANDEAGAAGKVQGQEVFDNSLTGQLKDALNKNQELQDMIDTMKDTKIPEADFSKSVELLKQLQVYKAPFDDQMKEILKETFKDFAYNPDNDPMLAQAVKYADRSMMEEMNRRGILSSSITVDNMRLIREDLLPKYQDMAFQKYNEQLNNNFKRIEVLQSLNATDYERYKNFVSLAMETAQKISQNTVDTIKDNLTLMQTSLTNQIALNKANAETRAEAYKNAMLKFKEIGYVDNEVSLLTGFDVGTISKDVEQKIIERYDEYNKLGIQYDMQLGLKEKDYEMDMKKVDQLQKQKDKENAQNAKAGSAYASLLKMSATDALKAVNKDFSMYYDYLGNDLWTLIDKLEARKSAEIKTSQENEQLSISRMNAQTAAKNAETRADNPTMSTADKNLYIAEASRTYKSYPTQKAIEYLIQDADGLISQVGVPGYKQIWDIALGEAVKRGDKNAQSFSNYFKAPKKDTTNPVDALVNSIISKYSADINSLMADEEGK